MAMQDGVTEGRNEPVTSPVQGSGARSIERSLTSKPAALRSSAMSLQSMGLLMSATSLIGPILADGNY